MNAARAPRVSDLTASIIYANDSLGEGNCVFRSAPGISDGDFSHAGTRNARRIRGAGIMCCGSSRRRAGRAGSNGH